MLLGILCWGGGSRGQDICRSGCLFHSLILGFMRLEIIWIWSRNWRKILREGSLAFVRANGSIWQGKGTEFHWDIPLHSLFSSTRSPWSLFSFSMLCPSLQPSLLDQLTQFPLFQHDLSWLCEKHPYWSHWEVEWESEFLPKGLEALPAFTLFPVQNFNSFCFRKLDGIVRFLVGEGAVGCGIAFKTTFFFIVNCCTTEEPGRESWCLC